MEDLSSKYNQVQGWIRKANDLLANPETETNELKKLKGDLEKAFQEYRKEWQKIYDNALDKGTRGVLDDWKAKAVLAVQNASDSLDSRINQPPEEVNKATTSEEPIVGRMRTRASAAEGNADNPGPTTMHGPNSSDHSSPSANASIHSSPQMDTSTIGNREIQPNANSTTIFRDTPSSGNSSRIDLPVIHLKLDKISLPIFNGDLIEWVSFRDQFRDLVHENPNLSSIVKFHQLRSHLKGPALEAVSGYKLTSNNYEDAWKDLIRRYDRTDNIVEEYIRKFMELPMVTTHSIPGKYTTMVDVTNQMLRALPNSGIDVRNWDPFVKFMLTTKLDDYTRRDWKQKIGRREQVPLSELLEFMEIRALEYQQTQGEQLRSGLMLPNKHGEKTEKKRVHQLTKAACPNCNENHPLYACPKLLQLKDRKDRTEVIKNLKLCFKCLGAHARDDCKKGNCPECQKPHNKVLCYQIQRKERENAADQQSTYQPSINHA